MNPCMEPSTEVMIAYILMCTLDGDTKQQHWSGIRSNKTSIKHSIAYVWSRLPWQSLLSHRPPLSLLSSVAHCSWFSFLTQRAWSPWQARRTHHPLHTMSNTNTNQHLRVTRVRNSISRLVVDALLRLT